MNSRKWILWSILMVACSLSLAGCNTPSRTAKALLGRWLEGDTRSLLFTEHGLFAFYHKGGRPSAGLFGVPRSNQIIVSQIMGSSQIRNLWKIELLDAGHLTILFPDGQKHDFTKAESTAPGDPQVQGLWESPVGIQGWNYFEFTPDGHFVQIRWLGPRNRSHTASTGRFHTEENNIVCTFLHATARKLEYTSTPGSLRLKGGTQRIERTYTKVESPKQLEKALLTP